MMPSTFMVPLDGSEAAEHALPVARALAHRFGADLVLMSGGARPELLAPRAYLEELAAADGSVPTRAFVLEEGTPADAIATAAEKVDATICMSTHGRGTFRWALFGSVAEDVLGRQERPALLVGRHCEPATVAVSHGPVIVCADGSNDIEPIVPAAAEWARALHTDLLVAMVAHPLDTETAEHGCTQLDAVVDQCVAAGVHAESLILRGRAPAATLADLARARRAPLVATTTYHRTGLDRFAVGSVTMGLAGMAPCPVLVVTHR